MARPLVEIVHALPRRVHLRARALAGQHQALSRAVTMLAREPANERVSGREKTGSIVIERLGDDDVSLDAESIAARLAMILASTRDEEGRFLSEPAPLPKNGPTKMARVVAHAAAAINRDVSAALDHRADLGTLFSIALGVGGFFEVLISEELPGPSWFNALWWSVRSFMTFNIDAVESEMDGHGRAPAPELDGEPKSSNGGE